MSSLAASIAQSPAPPTTFRALVEDALTLVRRSTPLFHADMIRALANRSIDLQVDEESLQLIVLDNRVVVRDGEREPWITTRGETILALVDAEVGLMDVMRDNRLRVRGTAPELVTFHEALMAFLEGCVRAPGMGAQVASYRAHVEARAFKTNMEETR